MLLKKNVKHQRQTFVNSVYVLNDRVVLNFNFMDDAKTVTREEVLGSPAVDNAPLQAPLSFDNGAFLFTALSVTSAPFFRVPCP